MSIQNLFIPNNYNLHAGYISTGMTADSQPFSQEISNVAGNLVAPFNWTGNISGYIINETVFLNIHIYESPEVVTNISPILCNISTRCCTSCQSTISIASKI